MARITKSIKKPKPKILYIIAAAALLAVSFPLQRVKAVSCPDLRIVFARGSGGERGTDANYLEYKSTIENKIRESEISYEFIDLDYPAISIGIDKLDVTLGAYFGSGDAYEFGDSVNKGVENLTELISSPSCPNTKYVIGGYSQGAMVISKSLPKINPNKLIYAATFGDPKIYLPEGEGLFPSACRGENLSDYRVHVPDCHAYEGLLGSYQPYQPETLLGKVGTWCNKNDIFCSSHLNISDHVSYIPDNLYEDASKFIYSKIANHFNLKNRIASIHDTAILIDSTGSMVSLIDQYKDEAYRLARETLESGGRVALFDYRDLNDPYPLNERCNFDTCTLDIFKEELSKIQVDGGGDDEESLLSASFNAMSTLTWKFGATKSIVVLTDARFLMPDRDGITTSDVINLSKTIDPVNFYIITNPENEAAYQELASGTDGKVITNLNELSLLTDYIMERPDSLPRVEESATTYNLPTLKIKSTHQNSPNEINIKFESDTLTALVVINDRIIGSTEKKSVTISGLDPTKETTITLVPVTKDIKGKGDSVTITPKATTKDIILPKAPNTGVK